jgi:hypothetical protein
MPQPLGRSLRGVVALRNGGPGELAWGLGCEIGGAVEASRPAPTHQEGTDVSPMRKMGDYTYGRELRIRLT